MYTTTSEIVARLGVLEKECQALLDGIHLMQQDLIHNGVIIYQDGLDHDAAEANDAE